MEIGEAAERAGVSVSAVRYYESAGLLPTLRRIGVRRIFGATDLERLRIIATARTLGFSIQEIRALVADQEPPLTPAEAWQRLAQAKLPELERTISQARALSTLIHAGRACDCADIGRCIESAGRACKPPREARTLLQIVN
ncbi:MerR family transcriptional regulator [Pseudolysinimonas sp.]|uniref:MerR family transcriptional regulator n=1 Tax=Pseudolysinimonas sp. TaxID=2680009 RepID=UPI003C76FCA3